jgi:hypothetical protein
VVPYLEHGGKLYPIEVPANIDFDGFVEATSMVMPCPAVLRTDTRFPIRADDRIGRESEQEVHLEQIELPELRREDELRTQRTLQLRQAWVMQDLPPKAVSRDILPPTTAFRNPELLSTSRWGDVVKVTFVDESGNHGVLGVGGWAHVIREGQNWAEAATAASGVPMLTTDDRTRGREDRMTMIKCVPNY